MLLTGLLTWLAVGRALRRTRRIAAEAEAISSDTLDQRLSRNGDGAEVDTIARVINEMLDRIEGGVRREQQFVADASHELRTPLATTRMAAELAGSDAPESPYPPQVVEEVDRMQALVDDLLELARSSADRPSSPVRLGELVSEVAKSHPRSEMLLVEADEAAVTVGRAAELRRVVVNLLDNATRYGDDDVHVVVRRRDDTIELLVDDDGPGIPPQERDRVFDRFTRLDEGRARDAGGSGLGLAIVRAIVERHGGSVAAGEAPTGGARLAVELPAAT